MRYWLINLNTTGCTPVHDDVIRTADNLGLDQALVAWSGCLDATHVMPAGACYSRGRLWDKGPNSKRNLALPQHIYRG